MFALLLIPFKIATIIFWTLQLTWNATEPVKILYLHTFKCRKTMVIYFSLILKTKWLWWTKNKLWLKLSLFLCLRGKDDQINSCQVHPAQTNSSFSRVAKSQAGHRLFPPGRARRPTQTLMAFTSQTVDPTEESGVTFQEMWEEVRSEKHVAEICWDTWAVALKSNTRVWAFVKKTDMNGDKSSIKPQCKL